MTFLSTIRLICNLTLCTFWVRHVKLLYNSGNTCFIINEQLQPMLFTTSVTVGLRTLILNLVFFEVNKELPVMLNKELPIRIGQWRSIRSNQMESNVLCEAKQWQLKK